MGFPFQHYILDAAGQRPGDGTCRALLKGEIALNRADGMLWDAAPLALIVFAFLPAYIVGFRLRPTDMSSVAEWIVGASWGCAMAGSIALAG